MSFLIDFSLFYYQCGEEFHQNDLKFTYYTDLTKDNLPNINKIFFEMLKEICNDSNYFDNLTNEEHNFHPVDVMHRKKIALIYEKKGKDQFWVQQNIIDCDFIYQRTIKDNKRRIFFILDKEHEIVRLLFIDLNHLIYANKGIQNVYNICYICHREKKKCLEKLNQ